MNFKVMEHEISLILFLNLQLQLVFKKMLLVNFDYCIKEESKKIIKVFFLCPKTYLYKAGISSYTLTETTYCNTLNAEEIIIQLAFMKSDIKVIC